MSPVLQILVFRLGFVPADPCSLSVPVPDCVERLAAAACAWRNASLRLATRTTEPVKRTCDYDKRKYLANETDADGYLLRAWLEPDPEPVAEPYYPTAEAFWRDHTTLLLEPPPPPPKRCFYRVRKNDHYRDPYWSEIKVRWLAPPGFSSACAEAEFATTLFAVALIDLTALCSACMPNTQTGRCVLRRFRSAPNKGD